MLCLSIHICDMANLAIACVDSFRLVDSTTHEEMNASHCAAQVLVTQSSVAYQPMLQPNACTATLIYKISVYIFTYISHI